mmetsp:Transcript_68694/g.201085  ORF Transcript_68694/g.201085 Transcript_68694/m.201085 type:complete len:230 (-) Transcript_68694:50-739(-)
MRQEGRSPKMMAAVCTARRRGDTTKSSQPSSRGLLCKDLACSTPFAVSGGSTMLQSFLALCVPSPWRRSTTRCGAPEGSPAACAGACCSKGTRRKFRTCPVCSFVCVIAPRSIPYLLPPTSRKQALRLAYAVSSRSWSPETLGERQCSCMTSHLAGCPGISVRRMDRSVNVVRFRLSMRVKSTSYVCRSKPSSSWQWLKASMACSSTWASCGCRAHQAPFPLSNSQDAI